MGRPRNVIFRCPEDIEQGCPLALHTRPNRDVQRTSFGERTSSGRNLEECDVLIVDLLFKKITNLARM